MRKKKYTMLQPEAVVQYIDVYWSYYYSFEVDYQKIITTESEKERNIELTKMYLSVCSEIEVMLKTICQTIDVTYFGDRMDYHREKISELVLNDDFETLDQEILLCKKTHLRPWKNYDVEKNNGQFETIAWWSDYNNTKHSRTNINKNGEIINLWASQNNVSNALGALFILEQQYLEYMSGYIFESNVNVLDLCKSDLFERI